MNLDLSISPRLNDGSWHHVSVKWMSGEVWLNLDYGQYERTQRTNTQIQVWCGIIVSYGTVNYSQDERTQRTNTQIQVRYYSVECGSTTQ